MIDLHYWPTPNGHKVTLFLEETGVPYRILAVNIGKGDQFKPDFLKIGPNNRMPAIVDHEPADGREPISLFESGAILLYLAEKTGRFLPEDPRDRGPLLSWLMFVASGIGPFSGQAVHFRHFAPETVPYAKQRYDYEARRHYGVLDTHLAEHRTMVGDSYTIVDMSVWAWARMVPFIMGDGAWDAFPNLKRLHDEVSGRPASAKALALKERFTFTLPTDDEGRKHMFKHLDAGKR